MDLTYGKVLSYPDLLTNKPDWLPINPAGDGGLTFRAGSLVKTGSHMDPVFGYFVGSPNSRWIPPISPFTHRKVRMRRHFNFGLDDPIMFPQPFSPPNGYLACIPLPGHPSLTPEMKILFYPPGHRNLSWTKLASISELGTFRDAYDSYQPIISQLMERIKSADEEYYYREVMGTSPPSKDEIVTTFVRLINSAHNAFALPVTLREALFTEAWLKRVCLELLGRLEWLMKFRNRCMSPGETKREPENIMGAFTSDRDSLKRLENAGIPVWYVEVITRRNVDTTFVHSVETQSTMQPETDALNTHNLTWRNSDVQKSFDIFVMDMMDADPPYETVWEGTFAQIERFSFMRKWILQQRRPCGAGQPIISPSEAVAGPSGGQLSAFASIRSQQTAETASAAAALAIPSRGKSQSESRKERQSTRKQPYPPSRTKQPPKTPPLNVWFPVVNSIMPVAIPAWENGLRAHSDKNCALKALDGLNAGYSVPDPNMIARLTNHDTRKAYIVSWLQLRQVMLYRLASPHASQPLSSSTWKKLLGDDRTANPNSKRASAIAAAHDVLGEILRNSPLAGNVSMAQIRGHPVKWRSRPIDTPDNPLTEAVMREILLELADINFRQDILNLDDIETAYLGDPTRRESMNTFWPLGPEKILSLEAMRNRDQLPQRWNYLQTLCMIMRKWENRLPIFNNPFPSMDNTPALENLEKELVFFYLERFYHYFRRPGAIHYQY